MASKSLIQIDNMSDSSREEPRLVDNSISIEKVNNDSEDGNLKTTERTDMMFHLFANEEKLLSEGQQEFYNKDDDKSESINDDDDDDINSYIKKDDDSKKGFDNPFQSFMGSNKNDDKDKDKYKNDDYDDKGYSDSDSEKEKKKETKEEKMLKKLDMLRKLGELRLHGVKLSQVYNMDSDYDTMKYEHELHRSIRAKKNGVQWVSSAMIFGAKGLEMLNKKHDPFSIKIDGLSDILNAQEGEYYEVIGELYEKYKKPGQSISPELRILFMLSMTIGKLHMANSQVISTPSMDDQLQSNPQLADQLRQQAIADKLREQEMQRQTSINAFAENAHNLAARKAADIRMLKDKKNEYMMANNNTSHINSIRAQLQQADINSMGTRISGDIANNSMHSAYGGMESAPRQFQPTIIQPRKIPMGMNLNPHLIPPQNNTQQENLRMAQILAQKKSMEQQELMRLQEIQQSQQMGYSTQQNMGQINPNMKNILNKKIEDDTESIISTMSDMNSQDSKVRIKSRRKRKKKQNLKVNL